MTGRGFDGIIEDIQNRDDDDVVGINRKKPVEKDELAVKEGSEKPKEDIKTPLDNVVKESGELIGIGIVDTLGIGVLKGFFGAFKK